MTNLYPLHSLTRALLTQFSSAKSVFSTSCTTQALVSLQCFFFKEFTWKKATRLPSEARSFNIQGLVLPYCQPANCTTVKINKMWLLLAAGLPLSCPTSLEPHCCHHQSRPRHRSHHSCCTGRTDWPSGCWSCCCSHLPPRLVAAAAVA